jgi:outer membrane autotransporter protein
MSGEIAADLPLAGASLFDPFVDAVFDHLADIQHGNGRAAAPRRNVWASGFTGSDLTTGDGTDPGSHKFKAHVAGFAGGVDWTAAPNVTLGVAVSAGSSNFHLAGDLGLGHIDGYQVGAYGMMKLNSLLYGAFTGAIALDDITTNRVVTVSGSDQLTGKANAVMAGGRFETGLNLGFLAPYLALRDELLSVPGYAETASSGNSSFALKYAGQTTNRASLEIGARQSADIPLNRLWTLRLSDQMGWSHDMSGTDTAMPQFAALPSSGFTVEGVQPSKDAVQIGLGSLFRNRNGLGIDLHLNTMASANSQSYTGIAGLNYAW